jgi:tRNA(Ile)-lysidine synthase
MPRRAALGQGQLLRPLLDLPRSALQGHALRHEIPWVEDPSNQQLRHDRNYLRAEVVPRLRERWPALAQTISRSARHCAGLAAGMADVAAADLDLAADGAGLDMAVLRRWPRARQLAVLRAWFARAALRSPETRHLEQVLSMLRARTDAHPQLDLPLATVRVHESRLLLEAPVVARSLASPLARPRAWRWRRASLALDAGQIAVVPDPNGDLDLARLPGVLWVFGTETAPGRGRSLRKLLQALAVPRWQREQLPLLYAAGAEAPVAVSDLWLHPDVQAHAGSRRRGRIVWRPKR